MQDRPSTPGPEQDDVATGADPIDADIVRDAPTEPTGNVRRVELNADQRRDATPPPAAAVREPVRSTPLASPGPVPARDRSWLWPLVSLIGLAAVIVFNWLANWLPLNDRATGDVSAANPVLFEAAGFTFSIWLVIYALQAAYVVFSFLPVGRRQTRINAVGPFFLVANIANISWLFAWHWERFTASMLAMVILLASVAIIYGLVHRRNPARGWESTLHRLLVEVPFSVTLAWVAIAALSNLQVWMEHGGGWDGGPFGMRGWAMIFLLAGILVAAGFAFFAHDAAFPLVFVWAYLGIGYEQWSNSSLVSITAWILTGVAAALTVMGLLLSFDARSGPRPMPGAVLNRARPGHRATDTPPTLGPDRHDDPVP